MSQDYGIVSLNYVSLYFKDDDRAIDIYSRVLGDPTVREEKGAITGWKLGDTWLTVFPAHGGTEPERNPCNTEFAIRVSQIEQVDRLYQAFVDAGATGSWKPENTEMYEPMRFAAVDDPFGVRIDIYCPHSSGK